MVSPTTAVSLRRWIIAVWIAVALALAAGTTSDVRRLAFDLSGLDVNVIAAVAFPVAFVALCCFALGVRLLRGQSGRRLGLALAVLVGVPSAIAGISALGMIVYYLRAPSETVITILICLALSCLSLATYGFSKRHESNAIREQPPAA